MSLLEPVTESEKYLMEIRLYVEANLGMHLSSYCCYAVDYIAPGTKTAKKVDTIRFQHLFPVKLPTNKAPYIDLFLDPDSQGPRMYFGNSVGTCLALELGTPVADLEPAFAQIVHGAEVTKKGVVVPSLEKIIQ